jgi:putative tryptophan/tyrosine transport system substrate-binding protein
MWCSLAMRILPLTILLALLATSAQPAERVRQIGFLASGSQAVMAPSVRLEAFRQALRALGWVEGQNLVIESRYAEGKSERLPELAADLVRRHVEVLVVSGGQVPVRAAQQATQTIPIVGILMGDPVAEKFVASVARPGGNITGLSSLTTLDLTGKRLELLKDAMPGMTRVAVLANPAHGTTTPALREIQGAAQRLQVSLHVQGVRSLDALEPAFAAMTHAGAEALVVLTDPLLLEQHVSAVTALALQYRLPTMYPWKFYADAGGLMAYSLSLTDAYRRVAAYVDKLLKGALPADLPVEEPAKFEFIINLKTAQALGLTLPPALLFLADEVLQ